MDNFKPLTLEDKELFDSYIKPYEFLTCEYSFTGLYIWRKGCEIEYTVHKGALIIRKMDFDGTRHFLQPLGCSENNLKDIVDDIIAYAKANNYEYIFKDLEEPFIEKLIYIYGDSLIIEEDRDNFDYIYDSKALISLSGKKLHSKKNHYNYFVKAFNYRTEPLSSKNSLECIRAAKEWCSKNECKGYLLYELKAIQDLLIHMDKLDFQGMVVYVNEKVCAFTLGERVNEKMAIIHIEKADGDIRGLYAYVNKAFVEQYYSDIPYINREQDLGLEGLRKAKESYQPIKLEKKYKVRYTA